MFNRLAKSSVYQFNQTVKDHIDQQKLQHFFEVTDLIKELIYEKSIFND